MKVNRSSRYMPGFGWVLDLLGFSRLSSVGAINTEKGM